MLSDQPYTYFNPSGLCHYDTHESLMEFVIRNRFTFNSKEQLLQTMKGTQALCTFHSAVVRLSCMVKPEFVIGAAS